MTVNSATPSTTTRATNILSVPGSDTPIHGVAHTLHFQERTTFDLIVDSHEQDEISASIANGVYTFPSSFDLLPMLSPPGARVLDLGAHIGTFSLLAASLGYQIAAVEASPRNATMLKASASLNGLNNLHIIPAAVSDRAETLQFIQAGPYGLVATPFQNDPTISVQAHSVDEILVTLGWDRVDFIKMDVEGSEVKAVAGMKKLLSRADAPTILYESNGHTLHYFGQTPNDLMTALESYGYHCYLVEAGRLTPVSAAELQFNCTVDYLATKKPLASLPTWSISAPLTRQAQVSQILATASETHPHLRSYIARTLEDAPLRLLADARVLWTLNKLAKDPDARVRESAAWFPTNIHLPFGSRHSKIAALQRYLALAAYALNRPTTRA
jgi:FkbM family methyltransferase